MIGPARYGPMTARHGPCPRRPIPTSSITTRTGWRSWASHCRPATSSTKRSSSTGRAFVPVDQGGQAVDFPLGIMQFPAMDAAACNECKTVAVGASFAINAASKHQDLAAAYLNELATPAMGKRWIETVYLQT